MSLIQTSEDQDWVSEFLAEPGHEFFCRVDSDYIRDKFNLTGLQETGCFQNFALAMRVITDAVDLQDSLSELSLEAIQELAAVDPLNPALYNKRIFQEASCLYGLIHARFIITTCGLLLMAEKLRAHHFDCCPRLFCKKAPLLPYGSYSIHGLCKVQLLCTLCGDLYTPSHSQHFGLDGAFWGPTFAHLLLLQAHDLKITDLLMPQKPLSDAVNDEKVISDDEADRYSAQDMELYVPRVFGFCLHSSTRKICRRLAYREHRILGQLSAETDDASSSDVSLLYPIPSPNIFATG